MALQRAIGAFEPGGRRWPGQVQPHGQSDCA
jgi:hypothetical protein